MIDAVWALIIFKNESPVVGINLFECADIKDAIKNKELESESSLILRPVMQLNDFLKGWQPLSMQLVKV